MQKVWNRSKKGSLYEVFLNIKNVLDLGNENAYDFKTKKSVDWQTFSYDMIEKYVTKGRQGSFDDYTEYNENVDFFTIEEINETTKNKILKLGYNGVWGDKNKYDLNFDNKLGSDAVNYSSSTTSPFCINLIPSQILHIAVPNLSIKSFGAKNTKRYSIIETIHITASKGETDLYTNPSPFRFKINDGNITFLHIQILDENYNLVNFNGVDWYIKFCFEFTYRNNLILPQRLVEQYKYMEPIIEEEEKRNYNKLLDSIINYRKKIST
jgi:hypothetical protein